MTPWHAIGATGPDTSQVEFGTASGKVHGEMVSEWVVKHQTIDNWLVVWNRLGNMIDIS